MQRPQVQLYLEWTRGHASHSPSGSEFTFFGAAMAHDINLLFWFLLHLTADNSSYFKSLVMLLKECVSNFFEAGEFSGKYNVLFCPIFILHI